MVPFVPPHVVGLVNVTVPAVGVGGDAFTETPNEAEGEVHPATVCVTMILKNPLVVGNIVLVLVVLLPNPAPGDVVDQL